MMDKKRLLAMTAGLTLGALTAQGAQAEADNRLAVAIGNPGSESFTFGTELWAMSQIALLPAHDVVIATEEVAADQDRLALLQSREVEAALVYGRVPNAYDDDVRAIMALWPRGISSDEVDPVQFLVHREVAADAVYLLTKAMFEHAGYFKNSHADLGVGRPSEAMTGLDIPLHAGAFRYYRESGFSLEQVVAVDYWQKKKDRQAAGGGKTTAVYHDFDDSSLKPGEIDQVAAACRQALEVGALSKVLGDLSHTGCEVYQQQLVETTVDRRKGQETGKLRSPAVAAFATSVLAAPDGEDAADLLFDSPVGQGGPAIRWVPPEDEARGRDDRSVRPLPARLARQPIM